MTPDIGNAFFEGAGAVILWLNVYRLLKDRRISGVSVLPVVFYTAWGFWNLYYYPSLGQWLSAVAGVGVAIANATWVGLALYYRAHDN